MSKVKFYNLTIGNQHATEGSPAHQNLERKTMVVVEKKDYDELEYRYSTFLKAVIEQEMFRGYPNKYEWMSVVRPARAEYYRLKGLSGFQDGEAANVGLSKDPVK